MDDVIKIRRDTKIKRMFTVWQQTFPAVGNNKKLTLEIIVM